MVCTGCGRSQFPRTDPAVIMAVTDDEDRCLLGRQPRWPEGRYSTLAGFVDPGESLEEAVIREVAEETGAHGRSLGKLGDVKYVYTWPPKPAEGERIFKIVSFFLVRYQGGRLGDVPEAFRHEVAEVKWLPLADAPRLLAYGGEKEMAKKALGFLENSAVEADV
jgi:NADH pyrophosphatase NudC (nudix superfamily)